MKAARYCFKVIAAILAVVALVGCGRRQEPTVEATTDATVDAVRVVRTNLESERRVHALAATVRPRDHAVVAARASGSILRAGVALGQAVAVGEILVTLESYEADAVVAAAEAELARISGDLARESALLVQGGSAADTVRALADQRAGAAARLEAARARLGYTRIAAPFEGVITRKFINVGDLASPGTPLFEIEGVTGMRAECEVPASLPSPELGSVVAVTLGSGQQIAAKLVELSTAVDPRTRTRLAKLDMPEGVAARYGDFVRVSWPAGDAVALLIPGTAISPLGQMERVFVVVDDRARLRLVKSAGLDDSGRVRISSGLDAGERVIVAPAATLRDGQPVRILL